MNIVDNFTNIVTKKYADFSGRASRSEYWYFFLANLIIGVVLSLITAFTGITILTTIYTLAMLVPGLAVGVRRLHDTGKSGWLLLIAITGIGGIVLLVFYCIDSDPGENKFGPNPKGVGASNTKEQQSSEPEPVFVSESEIHFDEDKTMPLAKENAAMAVSDDDDDKTVALIGGELPVAKLTRIADNKVIECKGDAFSVGKNLKSANYVISEGDKISRRHAMFYKKDGQYFVVDSSKNGTKINGVAVVQGEYTSVRDGDKITFADEEFIFNIAK